MLRCVWIAAVSATVGCVSVPDAPGVDGGSNIDAGEFDATVADGAAIDAGPSAGFLQGCGPLPPSVGVIRFQSEIWTLVTDTDSAQFTTPSATPDKPAMGRGCRGALVVHVDSFRVDSGVEVHVTGTRPLLIVSETTITINGLFDVSSDLLGNTGPGASSSDHCPQASDGPNHNNGPGGGAGGSFGAAGGPGGQADNNDVAGARLPLEPPMMTLTAGCPGGAGGENDGAFRAAGGRAGGAIHLLANQGITVGGSIDAGGSGGPGGLSQLGGGGGGGSGGYIGLEAPSVVLENNVKIVANGGGGGAGANMGDGNPGMSADLSGDPAQGGLIAGAGGDGSGVGSSAGAGGSAASFTNFGAGGGGGGVGVIAIYTGDLDASAITPAAVIWPDPVSP